MVGGSGGSSFGSDWWWWEVIVDVVVCVYMGMCGSGAAARSLVLWVQAEPADREGEPISLAQTCAYLARTDLRTTYCWSGCCQ